MQFEVWDETGRFAAEKALLEGYLPRIRGAILANIGRPPLPAVCHVVLSDRDTHARRFPFRVDLAVALAGNDGLDGEPAVRREIDAEPLLAQWLTYAHGIATVADPSHGFPADVPDGADVIALDVDTLRGIADEDGVDPAAAVAGTAGHEVSHVIRGHTRIGSGDPVHGYLSEGDAQRDCWDGLRTLLGDDQYAPLARQARVARARLKPRQPDAYQQFGKAEPDPTAAATARERLWAVGSGRSAAALTRLDLVELPAVRLLGTPGMIAVGDVIFVAAQAADWLWLGPWRVLRVDRTPSAAHPKDTELVRLEELDKGSLGLVWLTLRRMDRFGVVRPDPDDSPTPSEGLRGIATVVESERDLRGDAGTVGLTLVDEQARQRWQANVDLMREAQTVAIEVGDPDTVAQWEAMVAEAERRGPFADD